VPLHTPTALAPRRLRLGRAAAIAAACIAAGAATVVIADDQPAPQRHAIAAPSQPTATRYFDIEANKAASMRALSRHMMMHHGLPSPARVDAAAHAATMRAIGAALAKRACA
jgi:hypothetical protein